MGLDTIDLVLRIEDEFDLEIPDAEAEKQQTVGDTYRYLLRVLWARGTNPICPSASTFYAVRRAMVARFGTPREQVRPSATIGGLVPEPLRGGWKRFAKTLGLPVPAFQWAHPRAVRFPPAETTLRELICPDGSPARRHIDNDADSPAAVWRRLVTLIARLCDVEEADVKADMNYFSDLL